MPRANQIRIDDDIEWYECLACDEREFTSEESLLQHCRNARCHKQAWCERCCWLFVSPETRSTHRTNSQQHWICLDCGSDEEDEDDLDSHMMAAHSRCPDCSQTYKEYRLHRIEDHHMCSQCEDEFEDDNQLKMHKQKHIPRNQQCYGCLRCVASDAGILIHLESGNCASGVTSEDIDDWAHECYLCRYYTNDLDDWYHCPVCKTDFEYVSSLFQHIETTSCDAGYRGSIAKLRKYISLKASIRSGSC